MKAFSQRLGLTAAGLLLAAAPALAQAAGDDRANTRSRTPPAGDAQRAAPANASGSGDRAVPRETTSRDTPSPAPSSVDIWRPTETTNNTSTNHDVTNWSRPRGDRPATDIAVTRTGPRPPRDSDERNHPKVIYIRSADIYVPYDVGAFYGIPFVYFDTTVSTPPTQEKRVDVRQGTLKLKVKPRNAKVYVDGFYVGLVDEFDGAYQKLTLSGGRHIVQIRAEGFDTAVLDVLITPDRTVTFAGEMLKRAQ